jgi:hypothetical protein
VLSGGFDTLSTALAINNDSIYRSAENRLEVCNMQGEGSAVSVVAYVHKLQGGTCAGIVKFT